MLDPYDKETSWPAGLPEKLHKPLDDIAALVAAVREQQGPLLPSDMKREAARIGKNAIKLLDSVRKFERDFFHVFSVANYRDSAIEHLSDIDLSEEERNLCRVGMDPSSLQLPLLGLVFQMEAIAATKSKSGPREAVTGIYRNAVKETARLFDQAGIRDRALFLATCKTVLARAGYPATDDRIEDYEDEIWSAKS